MNSRIYYIRTIPEAVKTNIYALRARTDVANHLIYATRSGLDTANLSIHAFPTIQDATYTLIWYYRKSTDGIPTYRNDMLTNPEGINGV